MLRQLLIALTFPGLAGVAMPDEQSSHLFETQRYPGGDLSVSAVVEDFDGDGTADVAVANFDSNDVSVYLGVGHGGLLPETAFAVGATPRQLVAGDVDADGVVDLVTADAGAQSVSILLGNGDGTFAPALAVDVGSTPWSVVLEDLDSDGILDLATANYSNNTTTVRLGLGSGAFGPLTAYSVGLKPTSIASGDFDGNGLIDLVVCNNESETFSRLSNAGGGTFTLLPLLVVDPSAAIRGEFWVDAGDVDLDGNLDLAFANIGIAVFPPVGFSYTILRGNGDLTFQPPQSLGVVRGARRIEIDQVDSDGLPDLVFGNLGFPNGVGYFHGNGDGTFDNGTSTGGVFFAGTGPVEHAVVRDMNGDGEVDFVGASSSDGGVTVFLGRNDGLAGPTFLTGMFSLEDAAITDLDGDARLDLVVADFAVRTWLGLGTGQFVAVDLDTLSDNHLRLTTGDFNGDGDVDVAASRAGFSTADDGVFVLEGQGDGTLIEFANYDPAPRPWAIASGDLDGDGNIDLVTPSNLDGTVAVQLGAGDGSFSPGTPFPSGGTLLRGVAVADFDLDGALDVVVADNTAGGGAEMLLGDGTGSLLAPAHLGLSFPSSYVEAADLDRDGAMDLVTVHRVPGALSVVLGRGGGAFDAPVVYPVSSVVAGSTPEQVAIGDLNDDGTLDLVAASDPLHVFTGLGDGTFEDLLYVASGDAPQSVVIGDFDGDGLNDMASANGSSGDVAILLNGALEGLPFCGAPGVISLSSGGHQAFTLDAGMSSAGKLYWIAGSLSGSQPGFTAGGFLIPLNPDAYFFATVDQPGAQTIVNPIASLDASGQGVDAKFIVPPGSPASLAGVTLTHAFVVVDIPTATIVFASNAATVGLAP